MDLASQDGSIIARDTKMRPCRAASGSRAAISRNRRRELTKAPPPFRKRSMGDSMMAQGSPRWPCRAESVAISCVYWFSSQVMRHLPFSVDMYTFQKLRAIGLPSEIPLVFSGFFLVFSCGHEVSAVFLLLATTPSALARTKLYSMDSSSHRLTRPSRFLT